MQVSNEDVITLLHSNQQQGLNSEAVEVSRNKNGVNELTTKKEDTLLKKVLQAFINPFTLVLFVIASISAFTDVTLAPKGSKDPSTVIIIFLMVVLSGLMRYTQESKSGREAEKLKALVKTNVDVIRNGKEIEISMNEVVVGDIVILHAGDIIPADMRILEAKDLFISQSALTGESEPVEKTSCPVLEDCETMEATNLVFMGSNVVSGSAKAIVLSVGKASEFGHIAHHIAKKKVTTNFEKGIQTISWVLIRFMLIMVPMVFLVNGITKQNWLEAFLFALTIAIGLTPQMLPMVVTTNLSKGAIMLSKKKVVVKNMNAIQNFGSMDILCTDKTGTLTKDQVSLRYYLNINGDVDVRVLEIAYFNSYFQTGLKNLMDVAILEDKDDVQFASDIKRYHKVDEIPFDFERRRMSVVVQGPDEKEQLITKGAIEEMLSICKYMEVDNKVIELTTTDILNIKNKITTMNQDGMRVIAVAYRNRKESDTVFSVNSEHEMILIGYLAFLDPPKESSQDAIHQLHEYGIQVKILTGDNDMVTSAICKQVHLEFDKVLLGKDIEALSDAELEEQVEQVHVYAKLSPQQKARIITLLRQREHCVGYMGDGINDAIAMKEADVAISVDTAVDIAKEAADIILLEKDLHVLMQGVLGGRQVYANIIKYIKMTVSSNFGNMLSILVASAFLPFLPMLPLQILILNLIYDISCLSIPWDKVDKEYLKIPRIWKANGLVRFMMWMGPVSSIFDITTYVVMFFWIAPLITGATFNLASDPMLFMVVFHTGWFLESLVSQTLVIHIIRTEKIPFIQSCASKPVIILTTLGILIGMILPYLPIASTLGLHSLPLVYYGYLVCIIIMYLLLANIVKYIYIKKFNEWL